jgi:putative endonuclease
MPTPKRYYVYIMTDEPRSAILYTGITGNLSRRVWQHKNKLIEGFTSRHNLTQLVHYECFVYPDAAISREKEIKGWRRSKKIKLIEAMNPRWEDLAKDWQNVYQPETDSDRREVPRPARENAWLRDDATRQMLKAEFSGRPVTLRHPERRVLQAMRRISTRFNPRDNHTPAALQ